MIIQCHSRLVTPHIQFLVEVPVSSFGIFLTKIAPVLSTELIPNLFQSLIVFNIFRSFRQLDRDYSIFRQHIISHHEALAIDNHLRFKF